MQPTRRALIRNATLLLAVLAVGWPAAEPSAADTLAPSSWRIVAIVGAPAAYEETLDFKDGKASGKAACNRYFSAYTLDGTKLSFGPVGATRMHCGDLMPAEDALFAALGRIAGLRRDGEQLVLVNASGGDEVVLAPKT